MLTKRNKQERSRHKKTKQNKKWRGVLDTTISDKICQWLATCRWFSPSTPVSSTIKTEILLKMALNIITLIITTTVEVRKVCWWFSPFIHQPLQCYKDVVESTVKFHKTKFCIAFFINPHQCVIFLPPNLPPLGQKKICVFTVIRPTGTWNPDPLFPHLVPPAIMVWIFVWKYIFEPFIHMLQHFMLQLSRSNNFSC
jgi:hypothetical protein